MQRIIVSATLYIIGVASAAAQITPEISSWILNKNSSMGYGGILSNVQQVQYSAANVYVSATCIPGYDIGPWAGNPNTPANQNFVFKITRSPAKNTGTLTATGLGHIGVFANGVSIFNPKDAMSYNNENVWHQNAIVVEGPSFDDCLGHPAPNGEYHHHLNPTCLYNDSITNVHSPIVGYAFDGFPVYGAFAYAGTNGTGAIKRMQSSYRKRGISTRTTLPDGSTATKAGPAVSGTYPLGYYVEDYEFVSGLGDLDEHNGRFCITPEYPQGTYCYFTTLGADLLAEYPYIIGPSYYGTVQAGNTGPGSGHNTVTETVTTYTGSSGITAPEEIRFAISPNPAKNHMTIFVNKGMPNNLTVELINNVGQVLVKVNGVQPAVPTTLDVSGFEGGIYFVKIKSQNSITTKKVVIN